MGTKRVGLARVQALIENLKRELDLGGSTLQGIGGYSETDEWGAVRPTFVPGMDRGQRVVALGQMHGFGIEDMTDLPVESATTSIWVRDTDNSGAIATVSNDADFTDGAFVLTTGGTDTNQTGVMTRSNPFTCASGKKWWIETSIKLADHDNQEFFFGLSEVDVDTDSFWNAAAANGKDRVGFRKSVEDDDTITASVSKGTAGDINLSLDSGIEYDTDSNVLTMGIMWDGVDSIKFYAAQAATGTEVGDLSSVLTYSTAAGIPNDSSMYLALATECGNDGATETITVNYIRGAWEI